MRYIHLRNATSVLEFDQGGRTIRLLVDPMLARRGTLPPLRFLTRERRRNPLVELPPVADVLLPLVTHALVTHCQRGHFDHLDRAARRWLREQQIPVFCDAHDTDYLRQRGLNVRPLAGRERAPFFGGEITAIPCRHGTGWIGGLMEHGVGYFIALPGEPSVYLAGDTVLTPDVARCLSELKPDVAVVSLGGARLDVGNEILMDSSDLVRLAAFSDSMLVVNHLEALDHCPTTRAEVTALAATHGLQDRVRVPADGEALAFTTRMATPHREDKAACSRAERAGGMPHTGQPPAQWPMGNF